MRSDRRAILRKDLYIILRRLVVDHFARLQKSAERAGADAMSVGKNHRQVGIDARLKSNERARAIRESDDPLEVEARCIKQTNTVLTPVFTCQRKRGCVLRVERCHKHRCDECECVLFHLVSLPSSFLNGALYAALRATSHVYDFVLGCDFETIPRLAWSVNDFRIVGLGVTGRAALKTPNESCATPGVRYDRLSPMKFLWLKDPQVSVLFENDEIVAVDKPYGFDTHTNEAKAGQAEFIQPGLIELYEKQRGHKLHIVHRLDRTTTGVIVFAKTEAAAKIYQGFFRARETTKTYQFVTAAKSKTDKVESRQPIVRNGAELEAVTSFTRIKRSDGFELWEAHPKTGRNHQIRIHGALVGLPLLGDEKYGGLKFPFVCLHNRHIKFPNGVEIESLSPRFFEDLSLLNNLTVARGLLEIENRERIYRLAMPQKLVANSTHSSGGISTLSSQQSLRLIHREKESPDRGLSLDRFGARLVLSWYQDRWTDKDQSSYTQLSEILTMPIFVRHMKEKRAPESLGGGPVDRWTAQENEQIHEMRCEGLGLYLDQRLQRQWVKENSKNRSVLNLFAYTCGFGVAAAMGGAKDVTSVDTNKNMLEWGRENFEINGLDSLKHNFLCRDAVQFLEQAKAKRNLFDLIVCDPPNFARRDRHIFKIENELENLIRSSLEILTQSGQLLISTNSDTLFVGDIRKMIEGAAKSLKLKTLDIASVQPSFDFEAPGEKPGLKSFLVSKN